MRIKYRLVYKIKKYYFVGYQVMIESRTFGSTPVLFSHDTKYKYISAFREHICRNLSLIPSQIRNIGDYFVSKKQKKIQNIKKKKFSINLLLCCFIFIDTNVCL